MTNQSRIILNSHDESLKSIQAAIGVYQKAISSRRRGSGVVEDIRGKNEFLRGYKQGNAATVTGYIAGMNITQLVILFKTISNLEQRGALAWEIEYRILKSSFKPQSERFNALFREIAGTPKYDDFDHQASHKIVPQRLLLNLSDDGFGGRCDPLSKLVLVAKQLESKGQQGMTRVLLENLYSAAAVINNIEYYSEAEKNKATYFINSLKKIHVNTHASYNYDTLRNIKYNIIKEKWSLVDNNALTLPMVLNKLMYEGDNTTQHTVLLELDAVGHKMSAWSKPQDSGRLYGFYDPTLGLIEFSSANKFRQYMMRFFSKDHMNMAEVYQLQKNIDGESIFYSVAELNGDELAEFMPYKNLADRTTLKDIVAMSIFDEDISPALIHHVQSDILDTSKIKNNYFDSVRYHEATDLSAGVIDLAHVVRGNNPVDQELLAKRIARVITIFDSLATQDINIAQLNSSQNHALRDFFQRADGTLDVKQLLITVADPNRYSQVRGELYYLMEIVDTHSQFQDLSGKEALYRSKIWHDVQIESGVMLYQAAQKYHVSGIKSRMFCSLHGLYIGDGSPIAKRSAANLGLAWLYTLSKGEKDRIRFMDGLRTHTEINGQKIGPGISRLEAQQAAAFRQLINELSRSAYVDTQLFSPLGQHKLDDWLLELNDSQDGYYQLVADKHVLTMVKRSTDGQPVYYLYDPHVGEISFSGDDPVKVIDVVKSTLNDYLNNKNSKWGNQLVADYYGIKKRENQFSFRGCS